VRVAVDMVEAGLITKEEAIFRVEPNQLHDFLVPRLDERGLQRKTFWQTLCLRHEVRRLGRLCVHR